jgi:hypothetical protein
LLQVAHPRIYRTNLQYPVKHNLQPSSPLLPRILMLPQTVALLHRIFFQRLFPIPGLVTVCWNFKYLTGENEKCLFNLNFISNRNEFFFWCLFCKLGLILVSVYLKCTHVFRAVDYEMYYVGEKMLYKRVVFGLACHKLIFIT